MDHRKRPHRQVPGLRRPGKGRTVGTEIPAKRTAPHTQVSGLAFDAPLIVVNFFWFRQVGPPGVYQVPVRKGRVDLPADLFLYAIHVEWRQEFAVRHGFDAIPGPANSDEFLDMRIPWRHVFITDRPRDPVAKSFRVGELVLAPPLTGPAPGQRLSADLVSPDPVKRFFLDIRVVLVPDKKLNIVLPDPRRLADHRVFLQIFRR